MATVTISPGTNIQSVIDANPAGSTYRLLAGFHRQQRISPKTGDRFEGVYKQGKRASILSGARVLTNWRFERNYWWTSGQRQQGEVIGDVGDVCRPDSPRCNRPEDLFMDDILKKHVLALVLVEPGTWYFDYDADRIYVGDNPHGRYVECSVTPNIRATIDNPASNVLFEDLVVEKYAAPSAQAAVILGNSRLGGMDWVMHRCELRWNHGGAVWSDSESQLRECYVHHNGGFGLVGAGANIVIEGNEIAWNNTVGYNPYWGAGGSKWVWTTGLIVRGNFSHHNDGPGLWTDINNLYTLYEDNIVEDNKLSGIFHEISYDAIIRNNRCRRNGRSFEYPGYVSGAGIQVATSRNVEVHDNVLDDNWQAITGLDDHRRGDASNPHGPWELVGLHVHDNHVTLGDRYEIGGDRVGVVDLQGNGAFAPGARNRYERNDYRGDPNAPRFLWDGTALSWARWQAVGQDRDGSMRP